jgi:TonB family protein
MLAVAVCLLLQASAPPRLLSRVQPEYTEEARKARLNGSISLYLMVQPDGQPADIRVIRPLGLGLDEKAIAAVAQWRFQPGLKDGQAVAVRATVEVSFNLLPGRDSSPGWYTRGLTFQSAEGVTRPTLVHTRFMAAGGQEEGSVTLSFLVDEDGRPSLARVEKSSAASLEKEALSTIRGWEFQPAMKGGKPVAVSATLELVFGSVGKPAASPSRTTL